jgi:integrase/recombinase XerD
MLNDPKTANDLVPAAPTPRALTAHEFHQLAEVPPALIWFANIDDPHAFRQVGRGHVLAWRKGLEQRGLGDATIRRRLAALSSSFESLCDANAVQEDPVDGVKRLRIDSQDGKTPAIGHAQARAMLAAPDSSTLRGLRDRAMLTTLLYYGLRRAEMCSLRVGDLQDRRGVRHLQVHGKGGKIRYVPLHSAAAGAIAAYLDAIEHGDDKATPLFRPVSNNARGVRGITPDSVYRVLIAYAAVVGTDVDGFGPHALRATAATNALEHDADIAKVQQWLATPTSQPRTCTIGA